MSYYIIWLVAGLVLGTGFILFARSSFPKKEGQTFSISLLIVALIYIGFALAWGTVNWVGIETIGVFFYGLLAWLGLRKHILWTALGWALHPIWDAGLHLWGPGFEVVPDWYAIACISFDGVVALYILLSYQRLQLK